MLVNLYSLPWGWIWFVVCIIIVVWLYRKYIHTIHTINNGINLLKEQDYTNRLAHTGYKEIDNFVDLYNLLMDKLKNEYLRFHEQNRLLTLLIKSSPMGIIILDFDGHIINMNPVASELFKNEILKKRILHVPQGKKEMIRGNNGMIFQCSRLSFLDRGFHRPFILIDILTEEVRQAEKSSYEKVIRIMNHEINNSISGIKSLLEILIYKQTDIHLKELMQTCLERILQMNKFISKMADTVRIPPPNIEEYSLEKLINDSYLFLENLCLKKNVKFNIIKRYKEDKECKVQVDSVMFSHVLINIVKNAIESIEGENGIINIVCQHSPALIIIENNGIGLSDEVEKNLFIPFYTTKPMGQGIGLTFVQEVLSLHKFSFSLHTDEDGWTRFYIYF